MIRTATTATSSGYIKMKETIRSSAALSWELDLASVNIITIRYCLRCCTVSDPDGFAQRNEDNVSLLGTIYLDLPSLLEATVYL